MGEIAWRVKSLLRDQVDRVRVPLGILPNAGGSSVEEFASQTAGFRVSDVRLGAWREGDSSTVAAEWRDELVSQADKISTCHLSFFDLKDQYLGDPIEWNYDHGAGKATPRLPIQKVDYRDFNQSGDCKLVWEPNRHHHLVVLARAYRATGEEKYAEAVVSQLESWWEQNPFGYGMNWRSPLELGVRLINWVWALDLIRDAKCVDQAFYERIRESAFLHCWETARKFSKGSSANNHLVGEVAGVYVGASYFRQFDEAEAWRSESKEILCREIMAQTYSDGCNREHGLGYQFFVLQFYIISGLVGRWTGDDFPQAYWDRIERMIDYVAALFEGGEDLPMFGDRDDGYVLDLGNRPEDIDALMSLSALLFDRADLKARAGNLSETAYWLVGTHSIQKYEELLVKHEAPSDLVSRSFPESGYHLLQSGKLGDGAISLFFDCAELGYGSIAAHGHADALSLALRVDRRDVLVDPGTYDYFTYPEWRQYFRKTCSHNTVMIDGQDQSELQGAFLWGKRANAYLEAWQDSDGGTQVTGSHDGYRRLSDPVLHRRSVSLDGNEGMIEVVDEIQCEASHDICIGFQFSEHCTLTKRDGNVYQVDVSGIDSSLTFTVPETLAAEVLEGSESPKGGWVSRGYHQKVPAPQLLLKGRVSGPCEFLTKIQVSR